MWRALLVLTAITTALAVALLVWPPDTVGLVGALLVGRRDGVAVLLSGIGLLLSAVIALVAGVGVRRLGGVTLAVSLGALGVGLRRDTRGLATIPYRFVSDGDSLVGTVTRPTLSPGRLPAVVIAQGSLNLPQRAYAPLANAIARRGFVVLNYDRRGVGRSKGREKLDPSNNASPAYLEQLGRDLAAAVEDLARRDDVDSSRVGVVGISQGGWVAPIAASLTHAIRFALLISGPATSTAEEALFSRLTGEDDDHFGRRPPVVSLEEANRQVAALRPAGFDPRPLISRSGGRFGWLYGEWDNSVPVERSTRVLDTLIAEGKDHRYFVVPESNHGLMVARGDRARWLPYWEPIVWDTLATWLDELSRPARE